MSDLKEAIKHASVIDFDITDRNLGKFYYQFSRLTINVPGEAAFSIFGSLSYGECGQLFIDSQGYLSVVRVIKHLGTVSVKRIKAMPTIKEGKLLFAGQRYFLIRGFEVECQRNHIRMRHITTKGTQVLDLVKGPYGYITVEKLSMTDTLESVILRKGYTENYPTTNSDTAIYAGRRLFITRNALYFVLMEGQWIETTKEWVRIYATGDIREEYLLYESLN
ncbi:hypothetical protein D3C78_20520 [compost metagenome]